MEKENCRNIFLMMIFVFLAVFLYFWTYSMVTLSSLQGLSVNIGDPIGPGMFPENRLLSRLKCDVYAEKNGVQNIARQPVATRPGTVYLQLKVMGFPLKKLALQAVSQVKVVPGGQSIGIVMHSKGIMVVGMSNIVDQSGKMVNPAEKAGIRIGDLILGINGKKAENEYQLKNEIAGAGPEKSIDLEIKRDGKVFKTSIRTVMCKETNRPRIGLFVRDTASGVGTLSFYHPESGTYGALGHIITDIDTAMGIELSEGRITEASIRGIHRGKKGQPGEKVGMFLEGGSIDGSIERNSRYGIFGKIKDTPEGNGIYQQPLPVAMSYQVKKGPAEMLTVIDGTEVRKYEVEIQEIFYPWNNQGKGMIIKITDQELIGSTGGIVQGMSGSPIIQDGMLAGVLTHVFINDPLKGYGVPAEWMIKEAGIIISDKKIQKVS